MTKKLPYTPNSKIKAALHKLWLRSRERAKALKKHKYCCVDCGVKQSVAKGKEVKIEVHHEKQIKWADIYKLIREILLDVPQVPLCKKCHKERHAKAHKDIS